MPPPLADTFGVTVEELIGTPTRRTGKRGPSPKLLLQLECTTALPKAQQRFVMQMLEMVSQQQSG